MLDTRPKLAIVGYGAMGKMTEEIALRKGLYVSDVFDIDRQVDINRENNYDVAIDFSLPDAVLINVNRLAFMGKNIVLGTTGWYDDEDEIKDIVEKMGIGLVKSSNFSVGMNMFFRIVETASKMLNNHPVYDIMLHELHHSRKKDSPSGTAKTLAEIILSNYSMKDKVLEETSHDKIDNNTLHVTSTRGGDITGTHTVYIDSKADTIELIHRAKNRRGFAEGALLAAEWIHGKKGYFDFQDVLNDIWGKE